MMWSEGINTLLSAGVKSVTLANNHATDFGSEGLRYTEQLLESYGIEVVGVTTGKEPPYSNQVREKISCEIKQTTRDVWKGHISDDTIMVRCRTVRIHIQTFYHLFIIFMSGKTQKTEK